MGFQNIDLPDVSGDQNADRSAYSRTIKTNKTNTSQARVLSPRNNISDKEVSIESENSNDEI